MIKHAAIAIVLAGTSIVVVGCAKDVTGGTGGVVTDVLQCGPVADAMGIAKCAQKVANSTCGFLADIDPLIALVASGQYATAAALAKGICDAVVALPHLQGRRAATPVSFVVRGVVVTGHFSARRR